MSQATLSSPVRNREQPSSQPGQGPAGGRERVGVLHRQGERWRLVSAERRGTLSVVEARTLAGDPWSAVADAAQRHGFEHLVVVAAGRATVARCAQVPAGSPDDMGAAVSLLAEAQLPESLPMHRRAAGVIADTERPGMRTALLTGWTPDAKAAPAQEIEALQGLRITYTTPISALAALRGDTGAALYADPNEGAVSMLAGGAERTFARVLVEDSTAGGFWRAVSQIATETAGAAGVPAPQVAPGVVGPALRLDPRSVAALKSAVREMPDRVEWLNDYGIALGAALVATDPDPLVRPLAGLLETAPVIREPVVVRAMNWVAVPRHAWMVAAAAILLICVSPLAIGWARALVVDSKAQGIADRLKGRDASVRRQAVIAQMDQSRWPMTKLLADIAGAMPRGVIVDSLRLGTDQGLTLTGTAEKPELLSTMQANLMKTSLFTNVRFSRQEARATATEFSMSAEVQRPYFNAKPAEDYGVKTLAEHLYGPGASNTATPISRSRPGEGGARTSRRGDRGPRNTSGGDSGGGDNGRANRAERPSEASRPSTPVPTDAPPALTDEQIKAMDKLTAMKEMVARRGAAQRGNFDAGTKARLNQEADRLRDHSQNAGAAK